MNETFEEGGRRYNYEDVETCGHLNGIICSESGSKCIFKKGDNDVEEFIQCADTLCKLFSPKYKDKFALFAREESYLFKDVGNSGYWGGWEPDYKRVGFVEIQISEVNYDKEKVRLLIRPWMKNVIVKKIER